MAELFTEKIDFGRDLVPIGLSSVSGNEITIPILSNDALSLSPFVRYPVRLGSVVGLINAVNTISNTIKIGIDLDFYEFPSNLLLTGILIEPIGTNRLVLGGGKVFVEEYTKTIMDESRLVSLKKRFKAICSSKKIRWTPSTIDTLISSEACLKYDCDEPSAYGVSLASEGMSRNVNDSRSTFEFHIASNLEGMGVEII